MMTAMRLAQILSCIGFGQRVGYHRRLDLGGQVVTKRSLQSCRIAYQYNKENI